MELLPRAVSLRPTDPAPEHPLSFAVAYPRRLFYGRPVRYVYFISSLSLTRQGGPPGKAFTPPGGVWSVWIAGTTVHCQRRPPSTERLGFKPSALSESGARTPSAKGPTGEAATQRAARTRLLGPQPDDLLIVFFRLLSDRPGLHGHLAAIRKGKREGRQSDWPPVMPLFRLLSQSFLCSR